MTEEQRLARLADRKDYLQALLMRKTSIEARIVLVSAQIRELEVAVNATV